MGFTYVEGSTTTLTRVRLEIGDTDPNRALFSDEELNDIIAQETSVMPSSARACEILAMRFARDYDFSADGSSFRKGSVSQRYEAMAKKLRAKARGTTVVQAQRKDAYSDDITSEEATVGGAGLDFDRGRWDEVK